MKPSLTSTSTTCRPIKSYWHGAGQDWGVSVPTSAPGTCDQWASDSSLAVGKTTYDLLSTIYLLSIYLLSIYYLSIPTNTSGLASKIGEPASHILAPHRVHCNKRLIVICVETPSSGGGNTRIRRSPGDQESLLSFSQYRDLLQLQSKNDL